MTNDVTKEIDAMGLEELEAALIDPKVFMKWTALEHEYAMAVAKRLRPVLIF